MAEWRDAAASEDAAKTVRGTAFSQSGEQAAIATWREPKSDYKKSDPVTPEIFNELAENEKHLKEIACQIELQPKSGPEFTINSIVLMEV